MKNCIWSIVFAEKKWSHLTVTEKRVADAKKTSLTDDDVEDGKDDPSSGLMKIMQKMYETGDPEMKRMIAKAWTEGQEKNLKNPGMPQFWAGWEIQYIQY